LTHKTCDRTALDEIKSKKGKLYDSDVVDACVKLIEEERLKFQR